MPDDATLIDNRSGVGPMEVSRPVTTQQLSAAMYPTNYPANYPDTVVAQKSPNQNNSPPVHINGLNQASFPELVPSTMTDRNIFRFETKSKVQSKVQVFDTPQVSTVLRSNLMRL